MNNHMHNPDDPARQSASRWAIATAIVAAVVVAAGAFWASFTALTDLARQAGWPGQQASLLPIIVDGAIIAGTVAIVALRHHRQTEKAFAWMVVGAAAAVSIAANSLHATISPDVTIDRTIAAVLGAVAPTALLALTHLVVILLRPSHEETLPLSLTKLDGSSFVSEEDRLPRAKDDAPPSVTEVVELIKARDEHGHETTYSTIMAGWPETTQATASRRLRDARDAIGADAQTITDGSAPGQMSIDDDLDVMTLMLTPAVERSIVAVDGEEMVTAIVDALEDKATGRTNGAVTYRTVADAYGLSDARAKRLITNARKSMTSLERAA